MWQNSKIDKKNLDKNLKLMSLSAIALIVLFVYSLIKSDTVVKDGNYYTGIIFLFVLMGVAFFLQKYKYKFNKDDTKFQKVLDTSKADNTTNNDRSISPIKTSTTFNDIAGIDEIKEELEEVVDFLNNPSKYNKYNVSLPKGVLLVGPPGVGKTLIAKAVANEADVPFFYHSGASFVQIYVGMGAKRVKELFDTARANSPSIIFIDEIDAVGKSRGGSNDEREATLNELLTQMDGFDQNSGILVIAATNKIEILDEALLRAGRFDRRVFLTLPSKDARGKILQLNLKKIKYNFDLEKLVDQTSGFSSAALTTLINEALLCMIKRKGSKISNEDIHLSKDKIQFGKKQHQILSDDEKNIISCYQASKAFVTKHNVSLFDEGIAICNIPKYPSKQNIRSLITALLSGSIGTSVLLNEEYIVFQSEIHDAYNLASDLQNKYKLIENDIDFINDIKSSLLILIQDNKDDILKLKREIFENEIIIF